MRIPEEEPLGRDDDDDDDDDDDANVRGRRGAISYLSGSVWEKCVLGGWRIAKRAKIGKISPRSSNPNPNPVDPIMLHSRGSWVLLQQVRLQLGNVHERRNALRWRLSARG